MQPTFVDEQGKPISVFIARAPGNNAPMVPFTTASGVAVSTTPSPYPTGAVPVSGNSGNVANGSAVATLPAAPGKTTYLTDFEITAGGATLGLLVNPTVVGLLGGTATYVFGAVAGVLAASTPLMMPFDTALPASATNTAIVLTLPALGAGNTNASVTVHGYQL